MISFGSWFDIYRLASVVALSVLAGILIGPRFYGTRLSDQRSVGLIMRSAKELLCAVQALELLGEKPWGMIISKRLLRVFFPGGLIVNCLRAEDRERIGNPAAFFLKVVPSPKWAALMTDQVVKLNSGFWAGRGPESKVFFNLDLGLPEDFGVVIQTNRLPFLIGYRRHMIFLGEMPIAYDIAKLAVAADSFDRA